MNQNFCALVKIRAWKKTAFCEEEGLDSLTPSKYREFGIIKLSSVNIFIIEDSLLVMIMTRNPRIEGGRGEE